MGDADAGDDAAAAMEGARGGDGVRRGARRAIGLQSTAGRGRCRTTRVRRTTRPDWRPLHARAGATDHAAAGQLAASTPTLALLARSPVGRLNLERVLIVITVLT